MKLFAVSVVSIASLLSSFSVIGARGFMTVRFPVGGVLVTGIVALVVFLIGFGFVVLFIPKRKQRQQYNNV